MFFQLLPLMLSAFNAIPVRKGPTFLSASGEEIAPPNANASLEKRAVCVDDSINTYPWNLPPGTLVVVQTVKDQSCELYVTGTGGANCCVWNAQVRTNVASRGISGNKWFNYLINRRDGTLWIGYNSGPAIQAAVMSWGIPHRKRDHEIEKRGWTTYSFATGGNSCAAYAYSYAALIFADPLHTLRTWYPVVCQTDSWYDGYYRPASSNAWNGNVGVLWGGGQWCGC